MIYVDKLPAKGWDRWNGGAHMLTTDLDELHAMARRIGLKRAWFQGDGSFPHYDLTASKRALAVKAGAVEIGLGEFPTDLLVKCRDGTYETWQERHDRADARRAAREAKP